LEQAVALDTVSVLLIGLDDELAEELAGLDGFDTARAADLAGAERRAKGAPKAAAKEPATRPAEKPGDPGVDAVVISLVGPRPLETLSTVRRLAPRAAVVVVTEPDREADGAVAMHAGAEDHLVSGAIPPGLLPRAIRYAVAHRRLRRELATVDEQTGLANLRGFAPIADHHLRMADRAKTPVVFLFVRLNGFAELAAALGAEQVEALARDAAEILMEAVRDADVASRIAPDTFCVLLTGDAQGAETLVLSRLVEAIAVHDARLDRPRQLSLSVGSALYDPQRPGTLEQILQTAGRHLTEQGARDSSAAT
jgi:diguanylate cyclase (GGDEF)-like protein